MKATIRLFKAVPVKSKKIKDVVLASDTEVVSLISDAGDTILKETIKRGFMFAPEVVYSYSEFALVELIKVVEKEIGLTAEKMTNSFHKSWNKVKTASMMQLVIEQVIHYFTTYGFKALSIYDKDSVYIPNEKLEIPELKDDIKLVVIRGLTKSELKVKLLDLLSSGIALGEETINDVTDVATFVELSEVEIESIKNKEVKVALYDYLGLFPYKPVEFLRFIVYKSTKRTLLIKDSATIAMIKENKNLDVLGLLVKYKNKYSLERLAEIFYRFKPLWLAFRTSKQLKITINKIRRLAVVNHKPMSEDYLNSITAVIGRGEKLDTVKLKIELDRVNVFRKIRLAYALKFRTTDSPSILYKIRNGKGYAKDFNFDEKDEAKKILTIVIRSIIEGIEKNVEGKKIYIPDYITYSLPSTEKQFTGNYPSGTYVTTPKDMVFGIHWNNVKSNSVDLDLSLMSPDTGKIGWDSSYRTEEGDILFSGDITDAPGKKGASELFYVNRQKKNACILFVNYYNFRVDVPVPFKILVANEQTSNMKQNHTVNPNNVISVAKSVIDKKQMILGLLVTTTKECRFYFTETNIGGSISSSDTEFAEHSRKYLFNFYENSIKLNNILTNAGAIIVDTNEECDIDLSPEALEKDTIINLLK